MEDLMTIITIVQTINAIMSEKTLYCWSKVWMGENKIAILVM